MKDVTETNLAGAEEAVTIGRVGCTFAPGEGTHRCPRPAMWRLFTRCPGCASRNHELLCDEDRLLLQGAPVRCRCRVCGQGHPFRDYVLTEERWSE